MADNNNPLDLSYYNAATGGNADSGSGSGWLNSLIGNGGSILTGGATLINALNGKTPTTTTTVNNGGGSAAMSNTWIYVVAMVFVLFIVLVLVFKK